MNPGPPTRILAGAVRSAVAALLLVCALAPPCLAAETFTVQRLTTNALSESEPRVSGDRIVWYGPGGTGTVTTDSEIWTWTPGIGVVQLTDNSLNEWEQEVSGDRVVWQGPGGSDKGSDSEIFTWTPAGGVVQCAANYTPELSPHLSGDHIAWRADSDIWQWTPSTGATRTTNTFDTDQEPRVSGDRVVVVRDRGHGSGHHRHRDLHMDAQL